MLTLEQFRLLSAVILSWMTDHLDRSLSFDSHHDDDEPGRGGIMLSKA